MSVRRVVWRKPHPKAIEYEILLLDDGLVTVLGCGVLPSETNVVVVSGDDCEISGVKSHGDLLEPAPPGSNMVSRSRSAGNRFTLSDCFRGMHSKLYLWGKRATRAQALEAATRADHSDATRIYVEEGEQLACVTANEGGTRCFCYSPNGEEIRGVDLGGAFRRVAGLRNFYAFCGVLSVDRRTLTVHTIWNCSNGRSVGPPFDRRIATHVGLDFAPSLCTWPPSGVIMVRSDWKMPLVVIL